MCRLGFSNFLHPIFSLSYFGQVFTPFPSPKWVSSKSPMTYTSQRPCGGERARHGRPAAKRPAWLEQNKSGDRSRKWVQRGNGQPDRRGTWNHREDTDFYPIGNGDVVWGPWSQNEKVQIWTRILLTTVSLLYCPHWLCDIGLVT